MLAIGLMSGTSMDGIDASILELTDDGSVVEEKAHYFLPYDRSAKLALKAAEYAVRQCRGDNWEDFTQDFEAYFYTLFDETAAQNEIQAINAQLLRNKITLSAIEQLSTDLHIKCVRLLLEKAHVDARVIAVIGYHGQSLYHNSALRRTISIGDGARMAKAFGVPVVNKFRDRDVAEGGQGAPFAPLYHHAIACRDHLVPVGIVNAGGIANVTIIPDLDEQHIMAFDTGPANALLDRFVRLKTNGAVFFDEDGRFAHHGKIHKDVLKALHEKALVTADGLNFLNKCPPKSLDSGDMILIPEILALSLEDGCSTLAMFTSQIIVDSLNFIDPILIPNRWILAGGGWKHPLIRQTFVDLMQQRLDGQAIIQNSDEILWNPDALEANIFAYLAVRALQGKPLSLPNTTGVPYPMPGGMVHYSDL